MDENLEAKQLKEIGQRIREARQNADLTQADVAFAAGVGVSHISDVERGKKQLSILTFCKIIEAIRVSADSILRPDVPSVKYLYQEEFSELFKDCTAAELDSLLKIVQQIKSSLRANKED